MKTKHRKAAGRAQPPDPPTYAGIPGWGVDRRPEDRPGVPKEATPRPLAHAHWETPERQVPTVEVLKRADLPELTPVFGTAQPPRGLSGAIRRAAYRIPDHKAGHWLILLFADRVDVVESWISEVLPRRRRRR